MTGRRDAVLIHTSDGIVFDDVDYAHRIEQRLRAAGMATVRRPLDAAQPLDVTGWRAHVWTGGSTSVMGDVPWMVAAIDTMAELISTPAAARGPVIGICVGSQILAEAIRRGSTVAADRIEVGLAVVEGRSAGGELVVPQFHYEQISAGLTEAAGVTVDWANGHSPVQGFRYRDDVRGYQFHADLDASDLHRLIDHNATTITTYGAGVAEAHRSVDEQATRLDGTLFDRLVVDPIRAAGPGGR